MVKSQHKVIYCIWISETRSFKLPT